MSNEVEIASLVVAAVSALAASVALFQNAKTQKTVLIHSLHERFFEIQSGIAMNFNGDSKNKYNELLSNFFEYVALLVLQNRIKEEDIELLQDTMCSLWDSYGKDKKQSNGSLIYQNWQAVLPRFCRK